MTGRPNARLLPVRGRDSAIDIADRALRIGSEAFRRTPEAGSICPKTSKTSLRQEGASDKHRVGRDDFMQKPQDRGAPGQPPVPTQPSSLGLALRKAWAFVTLAKRRAHEDEPWDGLEVFDMLGGWQGTGARRRSRERRAIRKQAQRQTS